MRILVASASRHGATREIAAAIGETLAREGLDVDVRDAESVTDVSGYGAVVLGSAVYVGHWLEPARRLVERHGADLAARPTWLFSSGPLGDPPRPAEPDAVRVDDLVAATGAREHRLFAGRLDRSLLGFGERAVVVAVRAREGDFRDWDAIRAWARDIAGGLEG
jgi:menaquinone-dependent protoporphyrinogen oxidase